MRSVMVVVVSLAVVPVYADTPRPQPIPEPQPAQPPAPEPQPAQPPAPRATPAPDPDPAQRSKGQPRVLPPASLQDVMPKEPKGSGKVTGGMSLGGGFSSGMVVVPPPHPDDRPWPRGMVIEPPDVNDPIAIVPGTDGLAPGKRNGPETWSKRLADAVHDGIGTIVELVAPRAW
jgi:hypothetical protein